MQPLIVAELAGFVIPHVELKFAIYLRKLSFVLRPVAELAMVS